MQKRSATRVSLFQQRQSVDHIACEWRSKVFGYSDLRSAYRQKLDTYIAHALRSPKGMYLRLDSSDEDDRFLHLVRFTFARYPVPAYLEQCWITHVHDDFIDSPLPCFHRLKEEPQGHKAPDLIRWYIIVAQGGSLYRDGARAYLSRLETHYFLNTPLRPSSLHRALWYAVARAATELSIVAARISLTKLTDFSIASVYWKEVARFFARNPTSIEEMNDLIDYLSAGKQANPSFSLKGRTLPSLRRAMEEWHSALARAKELRLGSWPGRPIADTEYEIGTGSNKAIWRFRQIKTGAALVQEGSRMHHCVASYRDRCISGEVSIWSLVYEGPTGRKRSLTIEVRRDGTIAQCRGHANRQTNTNEREMVNRWAKDNGLKAA